MTPQPDFKGALEAFEDHCVFMNKDITGVFPPTAREAEIYRKTIRTALLIADALMQEPTQAMDDAGIGYVMHPRAHLSCFKAMRRELLKGI